MSQLVGQIRALLWPLIPVVIGSGCALFDHRSLLHAPMTPGLYRGVVHVHSDRSYDSMAAVDRIQHAAARTGLDFVILTDHDALYSRHDLAHLPTRPLLIPGVEVTTQHGHLLALGIDRPPPILQSGQTTIDWVVRHGGVCFIAHPNRARTPWNATDVTGVAGLEVYNFFDAAADTGLWRLLLSATSTRRVLRQCQRPRTIKTDMWHAMRTRGQSLVFIAGADAHIHGRIGRLIENLTLYLQSATMYVQCETLSEQTVLRALATGQSFIVFETHGRATDFSFTIHTPKPPDTHAPHPHTSSTLTVHAPVAADILVWRDATLLTRDHGKTLQMPVTSAGMYRCEVHRNGRVWIVSNPIVFAHPPDLMTSTRQSAAGPRLKHSEL